MAEKLARIRPTWYNTLVESHNKMYDREQSTLPHLCDSTPHDLRQGVLFYQKPPIKKAAVVAAARAIHMRFVPFDAAEEASDYLDALETPGGES